MTRDTTPSHPDTPTPDTDSVRLWMPPARLRRYQWSKLVGGGLVGAIFAGWLILQWSNPAMRVLAVGLLIVTAWVVVQSWVTDSRRARGRQVALRRSGGEASLLTITEPGIEMTVPLDQVVRAQWCDGDALEPGLRLIGGHQEVLAHLNLSFLADEVEARNFLGWLRRCSKTPIPTEWPTRGVGVEIDPRPAPTLQ